MANYRIKLNLQKLKGAFLYNFKGKTSTKRCICIPLEDNDIFEGQKGSYLSLNALEMKEPRYEDTHSIKPIISAEVFKAMSDEEKKSIPIIGGLHEAAPLVQSNSGNAEIANESMPVADVNVDDDLPF